MKTWRGLMAGLTAAGLAATAGGQPRSGWDTDLWGGGGYWYGDVTYQIGGLFTEGGQSAVTHFPLSELKWPIEVPIYTAGGRLTYNGRLEGRATFAVNAGTASGSMEDSDWEYDFAPMLKTTYSESDAAVDAWSLDGGARYWLTTDRSRRFDFAAGLGYTYQSFEWEASNLDQWYPQNPELGHDLVDGLIGTYEAQVNMPYLEAALQYRGPRLRLEGSFGFAPYMEVSDRDDHLLREILADTDADGTGWKLALEARYAFTSTVFALARAEGLGFNVEGTEYDTVYGGADAGMTWTIDHEITSRQFMGSLALGLHI